MSLKLLAVSETKQKLIGLYQLRVNLKEFVPLKRETFAFDKCIDKQGHIMISTQLSGKPGEAGVQ